MTPAASPHALKEWTVVCEALAAGVQSVLLRKGGIHEGPDGFAPEHAEFWLFPTGFHQSLDGVRPEFRDVAGGWMTSPPPAAIPLRHFCRVTTVQWIDREAELAAVRDRHILTDDLVRERFYYRRPGLFVLEVATTSLPEPVLIPHDPRYDGCRSWVTLNEAIRMPA